MAELGAFLLPAMPLLALLTLLLCGRYPGCEAVVRFAERIASCRGDWVAAAAPLVSLRPRFFAPCGGLLLALSLSGRAPPA